MILAKAYRTEDDKLAHIILREGDTGEHVAFDDQEFAVLRWVLSLDDERLEVVRKSFKYLETS